MSTGASHRRTRPRTCIATFLVSAVVTLALVGCNRHGGSDAVGLDSTSEPNRPQLTEVLDLDGNLVDPFQSTDAKALVFLFAKSDCPISNRYAPEVHRLEKKFSHQGVTFYLVYPDPDEKAPLIRQHVEQYKYTCEVLRDPRHELVRLSGVRQTPEAAVFLPEGRLAYRGRIDDRFPEFGKARSKATRHDLQDALEAVLAGHPVPLPATPPGSGCYIADFQ